MIFSHIHTSSFTHPFPDASSSLSLVHDHPLIDWFFKIYIQLIWVYIYTSASTLLQLHTASIVQICFLISDSDISIGVRCCVCCTVCCSLPWLPFTCYTDAFLASCSMASMEYAKPEKVVRTLKFHHNQQTNQYSHFGRSRGNPRARAHTSWVTHPSARLMSVIMYIATMSWSHLTSRNTEYHSIVLQIRWVTLSRKCEKKNIP